MKRTLCLFLALILAVGICFSAPVTITASAAAAESDFEYGENDGGITIYWYNGSDSEIVIPDTIGGMPVTIIEACAFQEYTALTSVTLPEGLTSIGVMAFSGCTELTEIIIPDSVKSIGNKAFYGCTSLETVKIGNGVETIGKETFSGCIALTSVTMGTSVKTIGNSAFADCALLGEITIPDGVETIGSGAFYYCSSLETVTIPKSVTTIGSGAFYGTKSTATASVPCKWNEQSFGTAFNGVTVTIAPHEYENGVCEACGYECPGHTYEFAICTNCSYVCRHETVTDGVCEVCGGTYCGKTESDTVVYFYNESTKTLTISGEGEMADFTSTTMPWYSYRSEIATIVINKGVTSIGKYSFYYCTALTSVTIPESVTTIGSYAFYGCTSLTTIEIPDSVTTIGSSAFYGCTSLTTIEIPDSVTTIGSSAFYGCTSLTTIEIPDSVTTIGSGAFYDCTSLTTIEIPDSVTTIGDNAFWCCTSLTTIEIPDSVTTIGTSAFRGCTSLTTIEIPDSVTTIGTSAFKGCTSLTTIEIPDSVTTIGSSAFYGCTSLTTVTIPSSVTIIESYAFNACTSLTTVTIPSSVTTIESNAFNACTSLTTIEIPDGVTSIVMWAFSNCTSLTSVTIPYSVTTIGANAFKNCTALTTVSAPCSWNEKPLYTFEDGVEVVIPKHTIENNNCTVCKGSKCGATESDTVTWVYDKGTLYINGTGGMTTTAPWTNYRSEIKTVVINNGVTTIGEYAFRYCESLTTIEIPDSVTNIGEYAFYGCTALTSVEIPDSVTTIDGYAFSSCTSLTTIEIPDSVTNIGEYAFNGCTSLTTVNVPCSWDGSIYSFAESKLKFAEHDTTKTATCISKAECSVCGEYGDFAPHTYENGKGKCTVANCDNACAHETITDGVCVTCGGKHCGNTENDKVVWFCDATDYAPGDENDETLSILTITGKGDLAGYTIGEAPWEAYRESIRGIDIKDGVTSIGNGTFCGCVSLTAVIIPGSVKTIGADAFTGCESLSNVRISEGVTSIGDDVFKECIALEEITIPESVETIGEHAFNSCTMLMTITIPQNVTVIGEGAFCNCTRLTEINVDEGNTTYSSEDGVLFNEGKTELICCPAGKEGDYEVPSGVTSISNYAFSSRGDFFAVTIPVSVTTIGDYAFEGSQNVNLIVEPGSYAHEFATTNSIPYTFNGYTEAETDQIEKLLFTLNADSESYSVTFCDAHISGALNIPATYNGKPVTEIGNYAFANCISLTSVTIPDSVTTIGAGAFNSCFELISITIPENVTAIGSYAFNGCAILASINVVGANTKYSSVDGVLFNKDKTELICYPTGQNAKSYTIPDSVITIGEDAFKDCTELTSVTIPDSVTTIGESAFYGCSELTSVTIPESVTTIGETAFYGCTLLETVIITGFNTAIGEQAFELCTNVTLLVKEYSNALDYASKNNIKYITYVGGSGELGKLTFTPIYKEADNENSEITGYSVTTRDTSISGALTIPSKYNGYSVTAIGDNAFSNCTSLTSVEIPDSVETIGADAFKDCSENLLLLVKGGSALEIYAEEAEIVYISFKTDENSNNAEVVDCSKLITGSLTIPSEYSGYSVTAIDNSAFSECTGLTLVIIPKSVTTIGENAFANCDTLNSVEILGNVTIIGAHTFEYCMSLSSITIPESVTEIGENAFAYCETLSSIVIPESVTTIGDKAFSNCTKLETVTIGKSVTTIGDGAFADCSSLSSVIIPNSVTTIGKNAFDSCTNLESVTIGENVGKIDDGTFNNCTSLETIKIPDSVQIIGDYAFDSCESLKSVTIGEKTETIGGYAFRDCSLLGEIKIPDSVKTIGNYAFDKCISLGTAIIGNEVKTIGDSAFGNCVNLKSLTIGKAVETIGELAFQQCPLLTEIVIPASVTKIGENALIGCSGLKYIFFEGTEEAQRDVADSIGIATNVHYGSSTHTFNENYTVDVEPTCTEKGSESQHCKYCELTQNERDVKENGHTSVNGGTEKVHTKCDVCEEILSAEHEFASKITTTPTCTEEGVETLTCECGYTYTKPVAKLGHDKVSHSAKSATCEAIGWYAYDTCSRCDYTTYKEIAKLGHDIVIDKAVEATCTKTGLTEGSHCTRCDNKTVAQQTIAKKAHTEVTVTGKAATCTATGLTDGKKCSVCGATTVAQQTIAKKAHTEVTVTGKAATCTATGLTDGKKCSVCGVTTVEQKVIAATGHKEVTVTGKAATCTATGLTDGKKCSVCNTVTKAQETIKAKGHITSVINKKDATCTADGYTGDTYCSVCKTTIAKGKAITKLGHSYNAGEITTKATCEKDGVKTFTCTRCKATKTETIKATGHKEVAIPAVAPTYTTVGKTEGKKCSVCGTITVAQKDVAKLTLATPVVTAVANNSGIKVNWNNVENAQSYVLYKRVFDATANKWSKWKIVKTGLTGFEYIDSDVVLGTKYRYTVRAKNGDTLSPYKTTTTVEYNVTPTVKVANDSNGVKVTWTTVANATGYRVYRSTLSNGKWSNWKNMGTAKSNKTSWTDKSVKSNVTYKYTVRAVYNKVLSSYNKAGASVLFLSTPTVKIANNASGIKVSWNKIAGATGYTVYSSTYDAKTKKWSNWKNRGTAKATATSWTDKKVESGVKYKYTVRAVNGKTKSTYVSSGDLLYLAQPAVTVKSVSNGINISWTKSSGATEYKIYRSEYNAKTKKWSGWKKMGTAKSSKTNWTDKSAKKGVQYKYTVKAVNGKTASTYKASSSVKR